MLAGFRKGCAAGFPEFAGSGSALLCAWLFVPSGGIGTRANIGNKLQSGDTNRKGGVTALKV